MNITNRIIKLAKELNLSQVEIARMTKKTKGAVNQWFRGATKPNGENLISLAKALQTTPEYLTSGKVYNIAEEQNASTLSLAEPNVQYIATNKVPLINFVQAGDWAEVFDAVDHQEWENCPVPHSNQTFAVKVKGESMLPIFKDNDIVFCDPQKQANNKDFVIASLINNNESTLKQLLIEDGQQLLKAINPNWHQTYIKINSDCVIVGKIIAKLEKF